MQRVPSAPLITVDPYFSLWMPHDTLNGGDCCFWTGRRKIFRGSVAIDGTTFGFLGRQSGLPDIRQTGFEVSATSTVYTFQTDELRLTVTFLTPLLLRELPVLARPASYISLETESLDGKEHDAQIRLWMDEEHCHDSAKSEPMSGYSADYGDYRLACMGRKNQAVLCHSGDDVSIDWGYLYLAVQNSPDFTAETAFAYDDKAGRAGLRAEISFPPVTAKTRALVVIAYDDIASINYFGDILKGYWTKDGDSIIDIIGKSFSEYTMLSEKCRLLDREITENALECGKEDYALLCSLAYRQTIAAHKLVCDRNGDLLFISKECFSNGCAATADVSYPSVPLYLLYNPELVKGMLRPILKLAGMPVWTYDFAPHDAGRYPHITGQVYALNEEKVQGYIENGDVHLPYYQMPGNMDLYHFSYQMPVEECGNMLIMAAAVAMCEKDVSFSLPHLDLYGKWAEYLIKYGEDPGEQLCTDDFAGHLAHNVNLSAKAIMGLSAYSLLLKMAGKDGDAKRYSEATSQMAESWKRRAASSAGHTRLTFDRDDSWSLKYNLIWDRLFGTNFFSKEFFDSEIECYLCMQNKYGTPLDSRKGYTKSDWILWTAAFSDDAEVVSRLSKPIARFLAETPDRVPFSDWYETESGTHCGFRNRTVQGGLFMPILKSKLLSKK